ncbi:MAG: response regulator [Bacteroidota bacterium]|nr:response regulator [Bacteroidota bacterium]
MKQPLRLLVVDDDRVIRRLWQIVAQESGLEVLEAGDPEHARKLLESMTPTVIVLDVVFPEDTGLHFLQELRHSDSWKTIPVIICSAIAEREIVLSFAREGICHYLLKPFALEEARERLREVLRLRGLLPEPSSEQNSVNAEQQDTAHPPAPDP